MAKPRFKVGDIVQLDPKSDYSYPFSLAKIVEIDTIGIASYTIEVINIIDKGSTSKTRIPYDGWNSSILDKSFNLDLDYAYRLELIQEMKEVFNG